MTVNLDYFKKILEEAKKQKGLKLTFVGIDPYPNHPSQIPFCKSDKIGDVANFDIGKAGDVILNSLGIVYDKELRPTEFFLNILLKEKKIAFINLSYSDKKWRGSENLIIRRKSKAYHRDYNKEIIKNSERTILCGVPAPEIIQKEIWI